MDFVVERDLTVPRLATLRAAPWGFAVQLDGAVEVSHLDGRRRTVQVNTDPLEFLSTAVSNAGILIVARNRVLFFDWRTDLVEDVAPPANAMAPVRVTWSRGHQAFFVSYRTATRSELWTFSPGHGWTQWEDGMAPDPIDLISLSDSSGVLFGEGEVDDFRWHLCDGPRDHIALPLPPDLLVVGGWRSGQATRNLAGLIVCVQRSDGDVGFFSGSGEQVGQWIVPSVHRWRFLRCVVVARHVALVPVANDLLYRIDCDGESVRGPIGLPGAGVGVKSVVSLPDGRVALLSAGRCQVGYLA